MKKLNLNVANLGATEVLSREELKKVLGGAVTGTGSKDCAIEPTRDSTGKRLEGATLPCAGKSNGDPCSYYRYNTQCVLYQPQGSGRCGHDSSGTMQCTYLV